MAEGARARRRKRTPQLVPIAQIAQDGMRAVLETAPNGVVLTIALRDGTRVGFAGDAQDVLSSIDRFLALSPVRAIALRTILTFAHAERD